MKPKIDPGSIQRVLVTLAALLAAAVIAFPGLADAQTTRGGAEASNVSPADRKDVALIWPQIPWIKGADLAEFDRTIRQSRDSVRKQLTSEFMEMMRSMMENGAFAEAIIEPVFKVLMAFDEMHEVHKAGASVDLGISLEAIFMAEFDNLYRQYDIKPTERHAMFARSADFGIIQAILAGGAQPTPQQKDWLVSHIRYMPFGTWAISAPGEVLLTFTLENLVTGERVNFDARGRAEEAARLLALRVFEFFQENEYASWKNPQGALEWVAPSRTMPLAEAPAARLYCQSQGARLPYARELLMAMQGSQFKAGGIPPMNDGEDWLIADRRRFNEQYYYFAGQEDSTGGAVRTGVGQGTIKANYWCVRGAAAPEILTFENLYRHLRDFEAKKDQAGVAAARAVLNALGDFEQEWPMPPMLSTFDEALAALAARGVKVTVPPSFR